MNYRSIKLPRALATALTLIASIVFASSAMAEPAHVLVRLPEGASEPQGLSTMLSEWRNSGEVSDVLVLEADRGETSGFEKFIVLDFDSEVSYETWARDDRARLPASLQVTRVDVLTHGEKTPRDSNDSVFKVNSYQPRVSPQKSAEYAAGYIAPLMQGQVDARIMMRYTMYLERIPNGKTWLLMEYRDPVAFEANEQVKGVLRPELLRTNTTYASYDKIKETLRDDGTETMAVYRELPPPSLPNLPNYEPQAHLKGGFRIVGSELKNAVDQLAKGFAQFHPDIKVSTSKIPSSEGGIAALYMGLSDVAPMGDDAKITDMMPFYNTYGYMPTEISVATGGYEKRGSLFAWAIVVDKDNPLEEISVDEIEGVFAAQRTGGWKFDDNNYKFTSEYARTEDQNIRTWNQLGLKDGKFRNRKIEPFGYAAPGFAVSIERHIMHWSHKYNPDFREYVEAKQAVSGYEDKIASEVPLADLENNPYAIGIAGLLHAKNFRGVKTLKVSPRGGGEAVALTPDNVRNRTYPLIRDAYFYVNKAPGKDLDPKVREFMRFVLSREGQEIIARVGYYYPLTPEYLQEQLKKLD